MSTRPATATARRRSAPATAPFPRRVSGPARMPVRGGAVALPAPRTGAQRLGPLLDRLIRGRACIWLIGLGLMGIVAMQVSLLKMNAGISRAVESSTTLERQNAALETRIARLSSQERVRSAAARLGMISPSAGEVGYVTVRPHTDAARAARRTRPPSDQARLLMRNGGLAAAATDPALGATTAPATGTTVQPLEQVPAATGTP